MKNYKISAVCGMGLVRQNNEDNLCVNNTFLDENTIEATKNGVCEFEISCENSVFAAVCDGMGGEAAGENASQIAVRHLAALGENIGETDIFTALREINTKLNEEAQRLGAMRIGCTAAILSIADSNATVINVGDSRVYRLRKRKLEQLSHDQSEVQMYIDAGKLSEKKARNHPMRHRIMQYLGMIENELEFEDAKKSDAQDGDVFLVCSDGLTECLTDKEICKLILKGASAKELYDAAMKKGGVDNTTIILVKA